MPPQLDHHHHHHHHNRVLLLTTQPIKSVVSASWLYPFKGIYFFATNPPYWPLLGRRLLPLVFVSIVVFGFLFAFAYLPQVAFLALFGHGPGAFLNAAFLVLGEGAVVVALLFEALMVDETLVDVFDAVLIQKGLEDLVSPTRLLDHGAPNVVKMLGRPTVSTIYSPFSFRQIVEFVFFLPLNFIPYVGTPAFLIITGARAGPFAHWRYFKLRGLTRKERNAEIRSRRWKYTWFGTIALILQLIPVLSMLFLLTTAAGSALWAVKLEEQRRIDEAAPSGIADGVADGDGDGDAPPYTDNPI